MLPQAHFFLQVFPASVVVYAFIKLTGYFWMINTFNTVFVLDLNTNPVENQQVAYLLDT